MLEEAPSTLWAPTSRAARVSFVRRAPRTRPSAQAKASFEKASESLSAYLTSVGL